MARSTLNFIFGLAVVLVACTETSDELPAGAADAGSPDGASDLGRDAESSAPADAAVSVESDGGPNPDGSAGDVGAPIRTVELADLVPERDRENLLLLPGFEADALNGSWLALPLSAATTGPGVDRRFWSNAPTPRPEVAVLPGTEAYPPGAGLYGFGVSPGTDVEGEIWLGLGDPEDADWEALTAGLIVYAQGIGPAIVLFEGRPEEDIEALGRTWRPFGGRAGVPVFGHLVIGVQNEGAEEVWVNGPRVASAPADGTRTAPPAPLPPAWRTVLRQWPR